MLHLHRSAALSFVLVLLLSCGGPEPRHAPAGAYWPVHDTLPPPPEGIATLAVSRLVFENDSVYTYTPTYGPGTRYPAYAADSSARFADSMYVVYQLADDSTLHLRMYGSRGASPERVLRWRPRGIHPAALPPSVVGTTYRFDLADSPLLLYFGAVATPQTTLNLRGAPHVRPIDLRKSDSIVGLQGAPRLGISYAESVGKNRVLIHDLLVCATQRGAPQMYVLRDRREPGGGGVRGPYPGTLYEPVVPPKEADQNIVSRLQLGRIEVLPPAPVDTSSGFRPLSLPRYGGIAPGSLPTLDFEFRDDSTYLMLADDEIVDEGSWGLSTDRNFLLLAGPRENASPILYPFLEYTDAYLSLELPISIYSSTTMYTTTVPIRFHAP